jgi:hypothetical protein
MSWTYDFTQIEASKMMQVRYLVGDTIASDQQVQDEEIMFALTQRPSIWGAASIICQSLASRMSRQADVVDKDLRTAMSARAKAYAARAVEYDAKAKIRGGGLPYAGGLSIADKITREQNLDRVQPQFNISMDDNYLPVPPVPNEGVPEPSSGENI